MEFLIEEYITVVAPANDLAEYVNKKIEKGYQPFGNIVVLANHTVCQPMVKMGKKE